MTTAPTTYTHIRVICRFEEELLFALFKWYSYAAGSLVAYLKTKRRLTAAEPREDSLFLNTVVGREENVILATRGISTKLTEVAV